MLLMWALSRAGKLQQVPARCRECVHRAARTVIDLGAGVFENMRFLERGEWALSKVVAAVGPGMDLAKKAVYLLLHPKLFSSGSGY